MPRSGPSLRNTSGNGLPYSSFLLRGLAFGGGGLFGFGSASSFSVPRAQNRAEAFTRCADLFYAIARLDSARLGCVAQLAVPLPLLGLFLPRFEPREPVRLELLRLVLSSRVVERAVRATSRVDPEAVARLARPLLEDALASSLGACSLKVLAELPFVRATVKLGVKERLDERVLR